MTTQTKAKKPICSSPGCSNEKRRRYVFCVKCWNKIPELHRKQIRQEKEDNTSLRAHPSKEWMSLAFKYTTGKS